METQKMKLSKTQYEEIIEILKNRFDNNMSRHKDIEWGKVKSKLEENKEKLWSLYQMEITGGEPDVIFYDINSNQYTFFDCSEQTPIGRRNVCYDLDALEKRKENKPQNNAVSMAFDMGIEILTEQQYRELQKLGSFDTKTSSWIKTPDNIRKLGGAVFCDCRYNTVFMYHNSAESYYSVRGFRGCLKV
jgi:hypothetical protein